MKKKIFVSYTTRDACIHREFLLALEETLSSACDCYIDLLHNNSLNKQARVEEELRAAHLVLLVRSESISVSRWVEWELQFAKRHEIQVVDFEIRSQDSEQASLTAAERALAEIVQLTNAPARAPAAEPPLTRAARQQAPGCA
jgi:hypothetical protein